MTKYYTDEKNALIVIALLKSHGIRKMIVSPGSTNIPIVGSVQNDSFFEIYSAPDERSAAYLACGLAYESGEPVALSCTGATASRNYLPGLTEAFYRKLPVAAITSSSRFGNVGHLVPQSVDRSAMQNDIVKMSVTLPAVKDAEDFLECESKVNRALLELKRHGGGPVLINLSTCYDMSFGTKTLPEVRVVSRISVAEEAPEFPLGKTAVFLGAHPRWTQGQIDAIDRFCETHDAVVLCDHTGNYNGKFRILSALTASQRPMNRIEDLVPDTLIHIGEISGDYPTQEFLRGVKQVWRVSEDGALRDRFRKLRFIFEMPEQKFFELYSAAKRCSSDAYFRLWRRYSESFDRNIPELPFSNAWIASEIASKIPPGSALHLGILNTLRTWNCFNIPDSVRVIANVGGFGIDGSVSTLIGASFARPEKPYFGVFGDLAFFYDMNALGNRHLGRNVRIIVVNNGKGAEFRLYSHPGTQFGDKADDFIAAARHYADRSPDLLRHYAQDLGFKYLHASDKEEFKEIRDEFLAPGLTDKPVLLEAFTTDKDESEAVRLLKYIDVPN